DKLVTGVQTCALPIFEAGVFLLPNTITIAVFGPLAGYLSDKRGPRLVATGGLVTSAIGLLLLTQLPPAVTFWQLAFPLVLVGSRSEERRVGKEGAARE